LVVLVPAQSVSAAQSLSPADDCSQTLGAPGTSVRVSHPSPAAVLQFASFEQMRGQLAPDWQTLPPEP
jgi:hypothetical protein